MYASETRDDVKAKVENERDVGADGSSSMESAAEGGKEEEISSLVAYSTPRSPYRD